jgi:hypothetical protein
MLTKHYNKHQTERLAIGYQLVYHFREKYIKYGKKDSQIRGYSWIETLPD